MLYLDSSATVKLLVDEPESQSLSGFLEDSSGSLTTSRVGIIELLRVASRIGAEPGRSAALAATLVVVELDEAVERIALDLDSRLRTLDAIHLASALISRSKLDAFVCYDQRLAGAATHEGLTVVAPA